MMRGRWFTHLVACFCRELQNRGSRTYSLAYAQAVLVSSCGLREAKTNENIEISRVKKAEREKHRK